MCFIFHNWSKWCAPVDTGTHFYKAQYSECLDCGKIKVRRITLWKGGNACAVPAEQIKKALGK